MLDKDEQEKMILTNYDSIYAYCLNRLSDENAALELTQDTFLLMIEKAGSLTKDFLKYWLYKVAENKCNVYLRKLKRENTHVRLDNQEIDTLNLISAKLDDRSFGAYFETYLSILMKRLSAKEVILCELRFIKGYSSAKIAEILHIKETAVNTRVSRLKKKMINIIEEEIPFL